MSIETQVDVLAVLDSVLEGQQTHSEIIEARAAVAELIKEASSVLDHVENEDVERVNGQCTLCHSYRSRLRNAIARVGGAT